MIRESDYVCLVFVQFGGGLVHSGAHWVDILLVIVWSKDRGVLESVILDRASHDDLRLRSTLILYHIRQIIRLRINIPIRHLNLSVHLFTSIGINVHILEIHNN